MQGNPQIIDELNKRLSEELTAIAQYEAHRASFLVKGYNKLVDYIQERIDDERKHYNMLSERIVFLGGVVAAGVINQVQIGNTITMAHSVDLTSEYDAQLKYNQTIELCEELGDNGTRALLESILKDEEDHILDLEAQLAQINEMTVSNYLSIQV